MTSHTIEKLGLSCSPALPVALTVPGSDKNHISLTPFCSETHLKNVERYAFGECANFGRIYFELPTLRHTLRAMLYVHSAQRLEGLFLTWFPPVYDRIVPVLYYLAFPKDRRLNKCLVLFLYLLDTSHWVLSVNDNFNLYARHFSELEALNKVQHSWMVVMVMGGLGSCAIQLFFCYRIWRLQKSKTMAGLIVALALMQCCSALIAGFVTRHTDLLSNLTNTAINAIGVWLVSSAVCDIVICVTLTYFLASRDTLFRKTKVMLHKIIRVTLETGLLTAVMVFLSAVLFIWFRSKNYFVTPTLNVLGIYSNSCMVVLNSRMRIKGGRNEPDEGEDTGLSPSLPLGTTSGEAGAFSPTAHVVNMNPPKRTKVPQVIRIGRDAWEGGTSGDFSSKMTVDEVEVCRPTVKGVEIS